MADQWMWTYLESSVVVLLAQQRREVAELVQLDLGEVDVEVLADVENLPDNLVGQFKHLLAETGVSGLLAIATDKQGCKLEAQADSPGSVVSVMLAGKEEAEVGNVVCLGEFLGLGELRHAIVAGQDDRSVEILVLARAELVEDANDEDAW